ncbi:MAG: hypothetical protein V7647_682 [Acidobacteriota bacterium]|jgi:ElaB/YqjD/DUF883 family membrane-anchored ribosome-binding protein
MEHSNTTNSDAGTGSGIMDRVRERATAQLSTQKDRATDGLGSVAQAVRQSTQHLRENKQDAIASYVEKAADQIDRFSTQLRNRDVGELVNEVQRFARRQPALFVGSAFAIGVIGARFLKSSSDNRRYRSLEHYGASSRGMDYAGRGI